MDGIRRHAARQMGFLTADTLGAIASMQGIGASLSGLAAGVIVDHFGYTATFLALGAPALVAVMVFAIWMPETAEKDTVSQADVCDGTSAVGESRHRIPRRIRGWSTD